MVPSIFQTKQKTDPLRTGVHPGISETESKRCLLMTANQITQQAFNAGGLIEKHLPHLSKLLLKGFQSSEHPYMKGFVVGSSEMVKERVLSKPKFL